MDRRRARHVPVLRLCAAGAGVRAQADRRAAAGRHRLRRRAFRRAADGLRFFNHAISTRVHASSLGPLDKSLGLVFGLVRGVVLVALAHMAMTDWFIPNKDQRPDVINQARTEPYVDMAATYIKNLVPQELKDRASTILDRGSKAVEQGKELNDTIQKLSPETPPPTA